MLTGKRPNILWVCTDQQRADTIGALGNEAIQTPVLDGLCRRGIAFSRAYCQSPACTPSRASFLTGRYPSSIGVNRNGNRSFPGDARLISRSLKEEGYRCGLIGKLHLTSPYLGVEERVDDGYDFFRYSSDPWQPADRGNDYARWLEAQGVTLQEVFNRTSDGDLRGYRQNVDPGLHQTTWCADEAISFIEEASQPWLLSLNFFDPHVPFDPPQTYFERYYRDGLPAPLFRESDIEQQRRLGEVFFQSDVGAPGPEAHQRTAAYYGMITLIDEQLGRVLAALDRIEQRQNTLVVFMSDHGEMLGDHGLVQKGCRFYEGLVRVPLIVSWPGVVREGEVRNDLVELTDIAPTIADLAGAQLGDVQGLSLTPTLTGGVAHSREYVRSEYFDAINPHLPEHPDRHVPAYGTMYFDGRFKLVVYHLQRTGELYDLHDDPHEFRDLWRDPDYLSIKGQLLSASFDTTMAAIDTGPAALWPY